MDRIRLRPAIVLFLVMGTQAHAQNEAPREQMFKERVQRGEDPQDSALGDWTNFQDESISQEFVDYLEHLVTDRVQNADVHRDGILIRNARFPRLVWRNVDVRHNLRLEGCTFQEIDLSRAHLRRRLSLRGSGLAKTLPLPGALFAGMIVEGDADFHGVRFLEAREVSFAGAEFHKDFDGREAFFGVPGVDVNFSGMTIQGNARFEYAHFVGFHISFEGAEFGGDANFRRATFDGDLTFKNAVMESASFHDAAFDGGMVEFLLAKTKTDLDMSKTRFQSRTGKVILSSLEVGNAAVFREAEFCGPVGFVLADIKARLDADGATFHSESSPDAKSVCSPSEAVPPDTKKAILDFGSVKVGQDISLRGAFLHRAASFVGAKVTGNLILEKARIGSRVDLSTAHIGADLLARGARFRGHANLSSVKVDGMARFDYTSFSGGVDLNHAAVGSDLELRSSRLYGRSDFSSSAIQGSMQGENANFYGNCTFDSATVNRHLVLRGAHTHQEADFSRITVHGNLDLGTSTGRSPRPAEFHAAIRFDQGLVDGNVLSKDATFHGESSFRGLTVKGSADFRASFGGKADFGEMKTEGDFNVDGAPFEGPAEFEALHVGRSASFNDTRFGDRAHLEGIQVANEGEFVGTTFTGDVNLEHSSFGTLKIHGVKGPDRGAELLLDHISFVQLDPGTREGDSDKRWTGVFEWLRKAAYSRQAYGQLEASLVAAGEAEVADRAFVEMKRRERESMDETDISRVSNVILEHAVAYGRKPYLAFLWSAIVVLFGFAVYMDPRDVQLRDTPTAEVSRLQQFDALFLPALIGQHHPYRRYNGLWYSLDLFLPFVNLHAADIWMPRQDEFFRRHYARVHTMLGWVLIPIALASITGLVS